MKLRQEGFGQVYCSSFTSKSRGVAILIKKNVLFKLLDCIKDTSGCYVMIKGLLFGEEIALLNVYNPPGYPTNLLTTAFSKSINLNVKQTLIGGDFNCHLNPIMDKSPSGKLSFSSHAKIINAFCEDMDYADVWRAQHLIDKQYTFFSNASRSFTRNDYFLLPKVLLRSVTSSSIGTIVVSDHAPIFIQYTGVHSVIQPRHWRLTPSLLKDQKFVSYFKDEFEVFMSVNLVSTNDSSLLWETSKAFSRGIIMSYTFTKKRKQFEQRKILEIKLGRAEREYVKHPSVHKSKEMSALRAALDTLLTGEAEKQVRFTKQQLYEHGDKAGRYLAYLTKKKADSQTIPSVIDRHGKQIFNSLDINNVFKDFYEKLYKSDQQPDSFENMEIFFSNLKLPCLSEEQRTCLDAPISEKEVLAAIKGLQSGKSHGPDGLSVEFNKELHKL